MIWVAMYYRLCAFGFLAGAPLKADSTANAGLQKRFSCSGCNSILLITREKSDSVTVIDQSAGASFLKYHLLLMREKLAGPFQEGYSVRPTDCFFYLT